MSSVSEWDSILNQSRNIENVQFFGQVFASAHYSANSSSKPISQNFKKSSITSKKIPLRDLRNRHPQPRLSFQNGFQ
jgi:hypothetical protein